jgi:hypothetical protein
MKGWTILILALGAGALLYLYEIKKGAPSVPPLEGTQAQQYASVVTGLNSTDPNADPDPGNGPTPQQQTEAAYSINQGNGTDLTLGTGPDDSVYSDPSDLD